MKYEFKKGDRVELLEDYFRHAKKGDRFTVIEDLSTDEDSHCLACVKLSGGFSCYPRRVKKVTQDEIKVPTLHYTVKRQGNNLLIGCQKVSLGDARKIAEFINEQEEVMFFYSMGDVFIMDGVEYMLSQVDFQKMSLINLSDGNRWHDAIKVSITSKITQAEFDKITDNQSDEFKKVEK